LSNSAGCDPYQLPKTSSYDNLTHWRKPDPDNKYQHGTHVTLSCSSGPVVDGTQESVCNNGQWLPQLGRCPIDSWTFICRDGVWYPPIACITPDCSSRVVGHTITLMDNNDDVNTMNDNDDNADIAVRPLADEEVFLFSQADWKD
uniref:Sushi domain-containing protein n=1 Tax=Heligmosomoides polygyrus TaxID=6339 RepID=A0A183G6W6_HELPZ